MKKVLLTTTAVVFTAGFASAGDMSMSGAIKLTYGGFGTGSIAGADNAFTSEADLDVAASSSSGSFSVSGTLEMDEAGEDAGSVTISTGSFSFTYDQNDIGALAVTAATTNNTPADPAVAYVANTTADGEDDNYGDYSISYSAGGLSVGYVGDDESDDSVMTVGYTAGALSLSMEIEDLTDTYIATASNTTTTSATYVTGPYTIGLSADDADGWDASVAMVSGETTVTVAADETETFSVAIAYAAGDITASASQEFGGDGADVGEDTTFGVTYTSGNVTFGAAYDSGNADGFGDEADTVVSASYVDGDVTIAGKANTQDEMEVSVSFAF